MYSKSVMDHFIRPRNVGAIEAGAGALGRGEAVNESCGDTVVFTVRVVDGVVTEARFLSKGCAGAIASCSGTTEWVVGKPAAQAGAVTAEDVDRHLGGLPPAKRECAVMAAEAARKAIAAAGA